MRVAGGVGLRKFAPGIAARHCEGESQVDVTLAQITTQSSPVPVFMKWFR